MNHWKEKTLLYEFVVCGGGLAGICVSEKKLIGSVVRGAKTAVVRGKSRISTQNRNDPEMTVPLSGIRGWMI